MKHLTFSFARVRRLVAFPLISLCLSLTAAGDQQTPSAATPAATLNDLAWIAGCWENQRGTRSSEEHWMKPAGEMMMGMSRTINNGKTVEYEFLRIHQEQGQFYYTSKPYKQAEASFKLKSFTADSVVFENPEHDFPQRIIYRKLADGSLLARIEGERNGQQRGIDFPFKRGKCE